MLFRAAAFIRLSGVFAFIRSVDMLLCFCLVGVVFHGFVVVGAEPLEPTGIEIKLLRWPVFVVSALPSFFGVVVQVPMKVSKLWEVLMPMSDKHRSHEPGGDGMNP